MRRIAARLITTALIAGGALTASASTAMAGDNDWHTTPADNDWHVAPTGLDRG